PVLLTALAEHRAVDVTDLTLLDSGDLCWQEDRVSLGDPVDPFATARIHLGTALAPPTPPLDRHPIRIAEPVLVEGLPSEDSLPLALDRLPASGPLTPAQVSAASAAIGLVRWDGDRWLLQPIALQTTVKRKTIALHNG